MAARKRRTRYPARDHRIAFTAGNTVFTDVIHEKALPKTRAVTILGALESYRGDLARHVADALAKDGIEVSVIGGLFHDKEGPAWEAESGS